MDTVKMKIRLVLGLIATTLLVTPAVGLATIIITIDGVDSTRPPTVAELAGPRPFVWSSLGDCDPLPSVAANACNGNPPDPLVAKNETLIGDWSDWGNGLNVDQVILGSVSTEYTGGAIEIKQPVYFIADLTGGGSAGPEPPQGSCGGVHTTFAMTRDVIVSDGTTTQRKSITSPADIFVTWCADELNVEVSNVVTFDLSDFGMSGTLAVQMLAAGPFFAGDPDIDGTVSDAAVPIPSTLALLGLGLAGIRVRRRSRTV
jgi:hypothetical protein